MSPKETVLSFWEAMNSNNFSQASNCLAPDFECVWPQSSEVIIGRANFVALNNHYPAYRQWLFKLNTIFAENEQVVTDVSVTDGVQVARAITFHIVKNGLIAKQTEFWPDTYAAPEWRSQWVKKLV